MDLNYLIDQAYNHALKELGPIEARELISSLIFCTIVKCQSENLKLSTELNREFQEHYEAFIVKKKIA